MGIDEDGARYQLRVTNGTDGVLAATASALRTDDGRPVAALAVEIAPRSAIRTGFALDTALSYERVSAEVHGDGVHLVVEAAPPRGGKPRRRWIPMAFAAGATAVFAGALLVLFGVERPRVTDAVLLSTPEGQLVARWSTTGNGVRSYEVRNARGDLVAQGRLSAPAGTMPIAIGDAASLRIAIANSIFGSDARDAAYARATAPPPIRIEATPAPRIESIAIDPSRPNAPLRVHYTAQARDVRLTILDRTGATWFSTRTPSGRGVTEVPAPPAGPREPYQLVVRAEGPNNAAGQELKLPLYPAQAQPSPSSSPVAQASAPLRPRPPDRTAIPPSNTTVLETGGGDTFSIRPYPVRAGQPFEVDIPQADGARVQLVRDKDDIELSGVDLRGGERNATLTAPDSPGSYTVRVTIRRGVGLETLVRALRFTR
jgi:hypothetical protein